MKTRQLVTWGLLVAVVLLGAAGWWWNKRRTAEARLMARGHIAFQQGDMNQAAKLFEEARRRYPDSFAPLYWLAKTEILLGRTDEARLHAEKAAAIDPKRFEPMLLRAMAFRTDARKQWEALVRTPSESGLLAAEAVCQQAMQALDKGAAVAGPDNADILAERGACLYWQYKLAEVQERSLRTDAARIESQEPAQAEDLRKRADEAGKRKTALAEQSLDALLASLRKFPKNPMAAEVAQDIAMGIGRYGVALEAYELVAAAGAATERSVTRAADSLVVRAMTPVTVDDWKASQRAVEILESFVKTHPKSVRARVYLAQTLLARGDAAAARPYIDEALSLEPTASDALLVKGQLLMMAGDYAKAKETIQSLALTGVNATRQKLLLAELQRLTGFPQVSRQLYRDIIDADTGNAEARIRLINDFLAQKQVDSAEKELAAALDAAPENEDILRFAATYYLQHGQEAKVLGLLDTLAKRTSAPRRFRETLAELYLQAGQADRAEEILKATGASAEGDVRQKFLLAKLAFLRGRVEESRKMLEELVAANPRWAQGRLELAMVYRRLNRGDDAAAEARKALELGAPDAATRLAVADTYLAVGMLEEARAQCDELLRESPNNPAALRLAARVDLLRQDFDSAAQRLDALNKLQGQTQKDWLIQAELAYRQGRYEQCVKLCREDDPAGLDLASLALLRMGKAAEAADKLVRLIELRPTLGAAYSRLVQAWLQFDTPSGALERLAGLTAAAPLPRELARGQLLVTLGRVPEAIAIYEGLLKDPKVSGPAVGRQLIRVALAACYQALNDPSNEMKQYDALAADKDTQTAGELGRFDLYRRTGQVDKAVEVLDRLSRGAGDDAAAVPLRRRIAASYASVNRADKALMELNRAVAAQPDSLQLVLDKIRISAEAGRLDEALSTGNEALARWPESETLLLAIARVQAARRDYAGAFAVLDRMAAIGETGRIQSRMERANLLNRMGLYAEAAAELQALASGLPASGRRYVPMIAEALIGLGRHAEARAELEKVPSSSPEYREARLMLARDWRGLGKLEEAISVYEGLLKARPDDSAAAYELCDVLAGAGRLEEAARLAEQHLARLSPRTNEAALWRVSLAGIAAKKRDWPSAVAALQDVVAAFPDRRDYRWQLALYRLAAGQTKAAANDLAKEPPQSFLGLIVGSLAGAEAAASRPAGVPREVQEYLRNPQADETLQLGAVLTMLAVQPDLQAVIKALEDAKTPLAELVRLYATMPSASKPKAAEVNRLLAQGLLARISDHMWLADHFCEEASRLDPDSPLVSLVWAPILSRLDKRDAAAKATDAVVASLGKTRWATGLSIARALAKNDHAAVLKLAEEARAAGTLSPQIMVTAGASCMAQGKPDEALAWFEQALAAAPDDATANNNTAYALAEVHGDDPAALGRALKLAEKAVSLAPGDPGVRETLGWVKVKRGDAAGALPDLLAALEAVRGDPRVHYHLGVCYHKLGQTELARMHLAAVAAGQTGEASLPEAQLAAALLAQLPATTRPATAPVAAGR